MLRACSTGNAALLWIITEKSHAHAAKPAWLRLSLPGILLSHLPKTYLLSCCVLLASCMRRAMDRRRVGSTDTGNWSLVTRPQHTRRACTPCRPTEQPKRYMYIQQLRHTDYQIAGALLSTVRCPELASLESQHREGTQKYSACPRRQTT
jgi:hypothetical protein